jgi:hypothetical protein
MAVNNEAKPRRSTRADILEKGSGQVFSYEHLQDKRLKRAEEDAAKEAKAKARRDRKSKKATQEAVETTTPAGTIKRGRKRKVEAKSVDGEANVSMPKRKVAKVSNVQVAEGTGVSWVAPLAKMY